jgi:hypothetical protein
MNCESCEEPKNSFCAATTGRMFTIVCGVIVSSSSVVRRSRTTRSIRYRPMRKASWMSSPTGAQAAVAEVLVLVEVVGDGLAGQRGGLRGEVLDLDLAVLGDAEELGQRDELAHERVDVVVREDPGVQVDVEAQARVELVAADAREVVALGVEEELVEERVGGVHRRRLARALLLEELDERALLRLRRLGIGLDVLRM